MRQTRLTALLKTFPRKYPFRFIFLLVVVPSIFAYSFWIFFTSLDHSTFPLNTSFLLTLEGLVVIIFSDTASNGLGWRWGSWRRAVTGSMLFASALGLVGVGLIAPNLAGSQSCCSSEHDTLQYFSSLRVLQVDWFAYCFVIGLSMTTGLYLLRSFRQEPRHVAFKKTVSVLALVAVLVVSGFAAVELWTQFSLKPTMLISSASTFSLPPLLNNYGYERSFVWNGTGRLYGSYSSNTSVMVQVMNRAQYETWLCEIVNAPHYERCPPEHGQFSNTYWLQGTNGLIDFSIPSPWITSPQPSPYYLAFHNNNLTMGAEVTLSNLTIGPLCGDILSLISGC